MLNMGKAPWTGFGGNMDATVGIARWKNDRRLAAPR
eukprot:gene3782-15400_t